MKKIFILFLLLLVVAPSVFTQTVDGQFVVLTNDGVTYSVQVQIKLQSGSENLGSATIRFTFNESDMSFPGSPTEGADYSFQNFQGGDYTSSVTLSTNTVSINIAGPITGGTAVTTSYIEVVTINFSISNSAGSSNLVWALRELFSSGGTTEWTLGSWPNENTSPLPVELSSFSASVKQNVVNLQWQTQTEVNNYGFEVERRSQESGDISQKSEWEKIGFVTGNGNSNSPKDYSFIDKNFSGGSKFTYRLKQIDNDGVFTYSDKVNVEVVPDKYELFQNYPNPFNPSTTIKFSLPEDSRVAINIYNILGEKVTQLINSDYIAGYYKIQLNSTELNLASGIYFYTIESKNFKAVKKMILMK